MAKLLHIEHSPYYRTRICKLRRQVNGGLLREWSAREKAPSRWRRLAEKLGVLHNTVQVFYPALFLFGVLILLTECAIHISR